MSVNNPTASGIQSFQLWITNPSCAATPPIPWEWASRHPGWWWFQTMKPHGKASTKWRGTKSWTTFSSQIMINHFILSYSFSVQILSNQKTSISDGDIKEFILYSKFPWFPVVLLNIWSPVFFVTVFRSFECLVSFCQCCWFPAFVCSVFCYVGVSANLWMTLITFLFVDGFLVVPPITLLFSW